MIQMLAFQMFTAALLFPALLATFRSIVLVFASATPMWVLAAILSAQAAQSGAMAAAATATLWIVALGVWAMFVQSRRAKKIIEMFAILWCAGGPVLGYVENEFAESHVLLITAFCNANPIQWMVAAATGHTSSIGLVLLLAFAASGLLATLFA